MKEEAMAAHAEAVKAADEALYNSGFTDGVASVPASGGISPAQEAQDIAAAVQAASADMQSQIDALKAHMAELQSKLDQIKALLG